MKKIRLHVRRLPFYLLALKAVWIGSAWLGVYVGEYWYISELQAHSVAFCAVLAYNAYIGRACLYLWVCIFSLFGLNVLNILYYFFNFPYLEFYALALTGAGLTFSFIHAVRKIRRL